MVSRACTVGVDVGGTKIAGVVLDGGNGVLESREIPTDLGRGGEDVLRRAVELTEVVMGGAGQAGHVVGAIGVGIPEIVSPGGEIVSDGVIPWLGLRVAEAFSRLAPCILESDVRAAARAEAELGSGRGLQSFAYVNVGTGISSTLVLAGRPYGGAHGGALVLASGSSSVRCPHCDADFSLVLEEIASGPAIVARYRELGGHAGDARDVVRSAGEGIPAARKTLDQAAMALGSRIALLVDVLDPEAVIVGGGLGTTPGAYWDALVTAVRDHIWWRDARHLPILQAALGPEAGAVGAALTARDKAEAS